MKTSKIYEFSLHRRSKDKKKFEGKIDLCVILHLKNKAITVDNILKYLSKQKKKQTVSVKEHPSLYEKLDRSLTFYDEVSAILSKHKGRINFKTSNPASSRGIQIFDSSDTVVEMFLRSIDLYEFN